MGPRSVADALTGARRRRLLQGRIAQTITTIAAGITAPAAAAASAEVATRTPPRAAIHRHAGHDAGARRRGRARPGARTWRRSPPRPPAARPRDGRRAAARGARPRPGASPRRRGRPRPSPRSRRRPGTSRCRRRSARRPSRSRPRRPPTAARPSAGSRPASAGSSGQRPTAARAGPAAARRVMRPKRQPLRRVTSAIAPRATPASGAAQAHQGGAGDDRAQGGRARAPGEGHGADRGDGRGERRASASPARSTPRAGPCAIVMATPASGGTGRRAGDRRQRAGAAAAGRAHSAARPAQGVGELGRLGTGLGIAPQAGVDRPAQVLRQLGPQGCQRGQTAGRRAPGRLGGRARADRVAAGEALVDDEAGGVDVALGPDRRAAGLLGRHVGHRAHHAPGHREAALAREPGHAEVGEVGAAVGADQDVAGLDVPVDHSPLVGVRQGARRRPRRSSRSRRRRGARARAAARRASAPPRGPTPGRGTRCPRPSPAGPRSAGGRGARRPAPPPAPAGRGRAPRGPPSPPRSRP